MVCVVVGAEWPVGFLHRGRRRKSEQLDSWIVCSNQSPSSRVVSIVLHSAAIVCLDDRSRSISEEGQPGTAPTASSRCRTLANMALSVATRSRRKDRTRRARAPSVICLDSVMTDSAPLATPSLGVTPG